MAKRPVDRRSRLEGDPFEHQVTKDGAVRISFEGRVVTTIGGEQASRLINALATADGRSAQLLLAKATGNFKRGNERR